MAFLTNSYGPMIYGNYQILPGQDSKRKRKSSSKTRKNGSQKRKSRIKKESRCKLLANDLCCLTGVECPFSKSCGTLSKCKYHNSENIEINTIIRNQYLLAFKFEIENKERQIEKLSKQSTIKNSSIEKILGLKNEITNLEQKSNELASLSNKEFKNIIPYKQVENKNKTREIQNKNNRNFNDRLQPIIKIISSYQKQRATYIISHTKTSNKKITIKKPIPQEPKRSYKDFFENKKTPINEVNSEGVTKNKKP
mgnify:CR=1 FL=1